MPGILTRADPLPKMQERLRRLEAHYAALAPPMLALPAPVAALPQTDETVGLTV